MYSEYQIENSRIKPEHYAEHYVPVFKSGHKLQKSKHKHNICPQCGINLVNPPFYGYKGKVCWVCFLKNKRMYKGAVREIKSGWFLTGIKWNFAVGWSFYDRFMITKLCLAMSNMFGQTAVETIQDFFTDWQIKTAENFGGHGTGQVVKILDSAYKLGCKLSGK